MAANDPGIKYPHHDEDQNTVNRNIYDNLTMLRQAIGSVQAHTIKLAKLTSTGTDGSITFNQYGIITGFVDPT